MIRTASHRHGFTLLELSVVIVVIALIVGGVIMGKSLLDNQRIRLIGTDATNYSIAAQQFKLKYGYMPGDFPTATRIWGRADGGGDLDSDCADPEGDASVGAPTCNGNGNGVIDVHTAGFGDQAGELLRAWQQLAAAGLILGQYTGINASAGAEAGVNVPAGAFKRTGYGWLAGAEVINSASPDSYYFDGDYRNAFVFGTPTESSYNTPPCVSLPPATCMTASVGYMLPPGMVTPGTTGRAASELDRKVDDGVPSTGSVRSFKYRSLYSPHCVDTTNSFYYTIGNYTLCAIIFMSSYQNRSVE
jgi:prepilin-type N-terminal cleavage/methylation domain-containing protein